MYWRLLGLYVVTLLTLLSQNIYFASLSPLAMKTAGTIIGIYLVMNSLFFNNVFFRYFSKYLSNKCRHIVKWYIHKKNGENEFVFHRPWGNIIDTIFILPMKLYFWYFLFVLMYIYIYIYIKMEKLVLNIHLGAFHL